jgi:hypothetical protein
MTFQPVGVPREAVADLMSTDLVTARPGNTIGAVAALMDGAGVRHILAFLVRSAW